MSATLTAPICSVRDGNAVISFDWRTSSLNSSRVYLDLVATYNGDSFAVSERIINKGDNVTDLVRTCVDRLTPYHFSNCINDPSRKALRSSVCENVINIALADYERDSRNWVNSAVSLVNDAMGFNGGGNDDGDNSAEVEQLRAELAAARAELGKRENGGAGVDYERLGAMINNAVTAALRPSVKPASGEVMHECAGDVLAVVSAGCPVWLWGPAGTGKSKLCEQIAEQLNADYFYTGAILDEFSGLKGFIDANGKRHETEFTRALDAAAAGRDVVMCLDECDGSTPEVLLTLNNLLAGGVVECSGKTYRMNEHLHVIACGNTNGRGGDDAYTRQMIDSATLDRFYLVKVDYSPTIETALVNGDTDLLAFVHGMRSAADALGLDLLITYRAITRLVKLGGLLGKSKAIEGGILRGLDSSDVRALVENMRGELAGNSWFAALARLC